MMIVSDDHKCTLYYKIIMTIASALTLVLASVNYDHDVPTCGSTYNRHSDDSRGIIYDRNMFIVQATGLLAYLGTAYSNRDSGSTY
jgi:hypothetical protein